MATIVNIFGKLYTFLRRPQTEGEGDGQANSTSADNGNNEETAKLEGTEIASGDEEQRKGEKNGVGQGDATGTEAVQSDREMASCDQHVVGKLMTDSTASSDWEHIPAEEKKMVDQKNLGTGDVALVSTSDGEIVQPELNASISSGTDVDTGIMRGSKQLGQESGNDAYQELPVDENVNNNAVNLRAEGGEQQAPAGYDVDTPHTSRIEDVDGKQSGKKQDRDKKGERKICQYYRRGLNCWRGRKCHFAHVRDDVSHGDDAHEDKDKLKDGTLKKLILEKDYTTYLEFVAEMTLHSRQINAKDLFYKLGYEKNTNLERVGKAVVGQYKLATSRNNWGWVKDARYFAELFFSTEWIDENLPHKDFKSNRKNRPTKKKERYNINEQYESPEGLCRDFRLKENPNLQTVTSNAAVNNNCNNLQDGKESTKQASNEKDKVVENGVDGYTEKVIQQAMKMAINDGLSESAIMEVIDDVATSAFSGVTPCKQGKLAKVDISRTPRSRPDQLAIGFNYHADRLVKESPKTVNGEIFALDLLPPPREHPDKLAVGFSYHAEQLVKNSPRTESGDILIPGAIMSPRRLPRDQLALGFSYHSDLIAKESPAEEVQQDDKLKLCLDVETNSSAGKLTDHCPSERDRNTLNGHDFENSPAVTKSSKHSVNDTFAVGFSYNSNIFLKQSLDGCNGDLPNGDMVSSLIEDAVVNEGRNTMEFVDEMSAPGLPAGSVW